MENLDIGNGARKLFGIRLFGSVEIVVTTTWISLLIVTVSLILIGWLAGRKLTKRPGRFQVIVEKLVSMLYNLVEQTMGKHNLKYAPYIGTLFLSSFFCSLIGMLQIVPSATGDLMVTLGWALITSALCWYENIRNNGFLGFLKGFTEPIVVMTPMNIISEIAQPVSMAFRHFGNVAGGGVLTSIIYAALASLSTLVFSFLPDKILSLIPPVFQVGVPAFLSIYFDLFSGFVQAFVFCLLTMVYVGTANPPPALPAETAEDKTSNS